ncbi:amino acid adenylation domain-containing protein [Funiculus sociatus GB2-A5]|uniref:Amino acid adenylation domain-containing protein n=1 Tax=Funiculus sociatus GB2-A5 TaxID=2933946 RepID=A0ABV0JI26_9CYAN|nr:MULTISPECIES: non-ribosomal peptide synthetase [Cyanophyceae]MBD1922211.1 amino acid adenylation domain-containing protein [Microcoleus sp. FACHB-831]MBD2065623.1 amino acid adenylation domain-containing protein [Trichocoleus sp. FACHB-6]
MKAEETEVFVFPASFAQQRLWFLDQLFPGNTFYNVAAALRLKGSLNTSALEETFNEIVRRHEALRTTFRMLNGQPVQVIAPSLTIPLPVVDLQSLPATEREAETQRIATQERSRPFDLSHDSLLRVMLLQLGSSEHVLLLNLHHIICDGWSIGVLIRELGILYAAFANKERSPLPELPIQYADFADWQREWLQGEVLESQLAYWKQQLDNIPSLNLPTDKPRPATPTYRGATQFLELPKSLSEELEALSQRQGVTVFMTLLAAFQILLYRYTQQSDILVGSPIANRNRREIEGLIGFFVNSLVLRTNLSGNPTFLELLSRVREVTLGAYAHQDLPFEKLVEELHPERNLSQHPLFQVAFSLQNTPIEALELPGLTLSQLEFDSPSAKFDLEFHLWESPESFKGQVIYSTDLFDDATITRMLGHYQTLLESIVANPQKRLGELTILTNAEQKQLLIFSHNQSTTQNLPSKIEDCFHQLFEAQVEQSPDAIALIFQNQQLTYRELNIRANQLAHHLQQLGVVPDVLVGICVERSVDMIVGLLGILKAGGAYLPLDPSYPQERLNFMLEDAQISILLTQSILAPLWKDCWGERQHGLSVVCLDTDWDEIAYHPQHNPTSNVTLDNLAYVIYTSGSTGKPKGVLVQHRGVSNLAEAQIEVFKLQPSDRILQFASLSFDASIFEIIMALRIGATLYIAKKESLLPGQALIKLCKDNNITCITLPPAVLAVLPKEELPALHTIICAGESCSKDIVNKWASDHRFFNAYGPTEATVWATIAEINDNSEKPPIGRPIANTQIYILDRYLQPVPIGISGELYISGDGLARGYLNRPELTAERFIPNPFIKAVKIENEAQIQVNSSFYPLKEESRTERLYKTGDLATFKPDGNIEFLGRIDEQVKIRGFRIELGESEAVLRQYPAVKEAVVIVREDRPDDKRLVAYIVPQQNQALTTIEIRDFLKKKLPDYMVPSFFVLIDSLPLTVNGKVARLALPTPFNLKSEISNLTLHVAPRTSTESTLAKIWAEVLNIERVGIGDNFFDLGGNSLLAIRLMDEVYKQFKRELPLSTLFLNPTVESLASTLFVENNSRSWSPLVAIQPKGSNPPFFCVHPIFGVVFPYYELAYHLGKNQPFYGLQPRGIDGEQPPITRIEDMAAYYIEALRVVQPKGPYFLGGWSFGGLVAFEMAQQLQKSGHEVGLVAMLDTLAPGSDNQPSFKDGFRFLFTIATRYIWSFIIDYFYLLTDSKNNSQSFISHFPILNKLVLLLEKNLFWRSILGEEAIANLMSQESRSQILRELTIQPMLRVFHANSEATLNYSPQVYPNRITLFKTSVQLKTEQDTSMGWSNLAVGGVEIHNIPGNHLTMLKKPHVQVLCEQLKACIEKV